MKLFKEAQLITALTPKLSGQAWDISLKFGQGTRRHVTGPQENHWDITFLNDVQEQT
jgi:hypothetical protein